MKIEIKGTIIGNDDAWIYDWLDMEYTSPKKVNDLINKCAVNEKIEVNINSGGGSVFAGSEIYTALKSYKGEVEGIIPSIAASAASVVAMGCSKLSISPTAQIMIHNASCGVGGDYRDMEHTAEFLKGINTSIASAYELKTKIKHEDLIELMNKETWLTAKQALEMGFADEVLFKDNAGPTNSIDGFMLPTNIINKLKNKLKKVPEQLQIPDDNKKELEEIKNQLELEKAKLKMRGNL